MKAIDVIALILVIVGGVNWALVGLAEMDLVAMITGGSFGQVTTLGMWVYVLVGLGAVWCLFRMGAFLGGKSKSKSTAEPAGEAGS